MKTKHDFVNFFSQTLISKKIVISSDNKVCIDIVSAKLLRISTINQITSSIIENSMETQKQLPRHSTETQFFHKKIPSLHKIWRCVG